MAILPHGGKNFFIVIVPTSPPAPSPRLVGERGNFMKESRLVGTLRRSYIRLW
jgi:hypothetical protein